MSSLYCSDDQRKAAPTGRKHKSPDAGYVRELTVSISPVGHAAYSQPNLRPTEYRCYIKEDVQYATAGAVISSWNIPSSFGQLPVPMALNARSPTLFGITIHDVTGKVNRFLQKMEIPGRKGKKHDVDKKWLNFPWVFVIMGLTLQGSYIGYYSGFPSLGGGFDSRTLLQKKKRCLWHLFFFWLREGIEPI